MKKNIIYRSTIKEVEDENHVIKKLAKIKLISEKT